MIDYSNCVALVRSRLCGRNNEVDDRVFNTANKLLSINDNVLFVAVIAGYEHDRGKSTVFNVYK